MLIRTPWFAAMQAAQKVLVLAAAALAAFAAMQAAQKMGALMIR